jgi:hypothetical protein
MMIVNTSVDKNWVTSLLCCVLTALCSGALGVAGWGIADLRRRPSAVNVMALAGLGLIGALLASTAIAHANHYADRARLNERSVLAEILAAPICSGPAKHGARR